MTKPEDPIWLPKKSTPRGPPEELFPLNLGDAGLPVGLDAVDEDPGEPLFDGLPDDDWTAYLGDLRGCWVAKPCAHRADQVQLTLEFAVDGGDRLA